MTTPKMKDGKSPFASLTIWGGSIFAVLQFLESQGVVPGGAAQSTVDFASTLAAILGMYGLRRAIG